MDKDTNLHTRTRTVQPLVIPVMRRNLVHIIQSHKINEAFKSTKVSIRHLRYDHDKPFEIEKKMKSDYWFSVLDATIVKIIRWYRLNKQGYRGGRRKKPRWRQMGVNDNMLVPVPITRKIPLKDKNNTCIWMSLPNAQSIQDKDCAIVDYFLSNNISMAIITESWL